MLAASARRRFATRRAGDVLAYHQRDKKMLGRVVFKAPLIGWLLDDALNGLPDAKYYFAANLLIVFGFAVFKYGYAVVIVTALTATALYMAFLIAITASDLVESYRKAPEVNGRTAHDRRASV